MQYGLIGLTTAVMLASAMATSGCNTTTDPVGTGGSPSTGQTGGNGGSSTSVGTGGSGTSATTGGTSAGGASGTGSVTNLSGSKTLSALTSAEASQLCSDAYAYYGRTIDRATLCRAQGVTHGVSTSPPTDPVLQENCKSQETSCLQANPSNPTCDPFPTPCTASVAQYSACITDYAAAFNQGAAELVGCATITLNDLPAVWNFVTAEPPVTCVTLNDNCAGVNYPSPR